MMRNTMETYRTVAATGYDLDEAGLENHFVLARFDYTLEDDAALRGYLREMLLKHGEHAVDLRDTHTGRRLLLAPPGNDAVLETMDQLREAMDEHGFLREEDWMECIEEAIQGRWEDMDLDERIDFCLSVGEDVGYALQTVPADDLCVHLEEIISYG